jgi:hypothetical protein
MGTVGLRPVEGKKTVFTLGDDVTVRGWARPRPSPLAGHVILGIKGSARWTELLIHPEGHVVASVAGRTEQEAYRALNGQCEALFGVPYGDATDGPFDWR